MKQKDFIAILKKYKQGVATSAEKKLIDEWYASMKNAVHQEIGDSELENLYYSRIHPHLKNSKNNKIRTLIGWSSGIAASLLVATVTYLFISAPSDVSNMSLKKTEAFSPSRYISNATQETLITILPDSSKVSLEPGSTMKFLYNSTERTVALNGEAFFEVTHNPEVPFFVHANEVITKVLGTSFSVKAREGERQITVAVKTGKVSVYAIQESVPASSTPKEIILTPNQQIVFDKTEKEISKQIVKNPQIILPIEQIRLMRFEEAPVSEIFRALEKAYGVDLHFDETIFSLCELTTVIAEDGLYNRLDIICEAIGTSYQLKDDQIVISDTGCHADRTK
jgi:ferric-dicitrate binding protein FerR (iron transport regulator)